MTAKESKAVAWLSVYSAKVGFSDDGDSEYHFSGKVPVGKYAIVPESALHAAEAELGELRRRVGELAAELVAQSDAAYVRYIGELSAYECKGKEHKMRHGKFGDAELTAHISASNKLTTHRELMAVATQLRQLLASDGGADGDGRTS